MSEKNILKWASYFLFIVVITSSLFQLYFTHQIKEEQSSIQKVQMLLNLTDELSANLGSVQQTFRSYSIARDPEALTNLVKFQNVVSKVLIEQLTLSAEYPDLKNLVEKIDRIYHTENKAINSYIAAHPKDLVTEQSIKAVEQSESGMGMVWTLLFEYKERLKNRVKSTNQDINDVSAKSYSANIGSLVLLLILLILNGYNFLRKRRIETTSASSGVISEQDMLLGALLENTSTCMMIRDRAGKILFANKATQEFIGLNEKDIVGKTFDRLEFTKEIQYGNSDIRIDVNYPYFETEERVFVDGKTLYFFTRQFPIKNSRGEVIASGLISRNITERIVYEEGLKKSRHEAENARLTQEQFMANISHEIRTPMNGIMGMTSLLSETSLDATQDEYLEIIRQSSKNLMVLINDILDFSKIEAGKLELEKIAFKITDVLTQVIDSMQVKAKEKQLPVHLTIDHKVPLGVLGDPLRLHQIISNILSNAIKFTSEGAIHIDVTAQSCNFGIVKLQFRITDTGIGIPEERIGYIFQSFTQTSLDITRKFGGTGLGLAIVKQLVELFEGKISVTSKVGNGSSFLIEIPFSTVPVANRSTEEEAKFALLCNKRILVVEDNIINQKVIIKTLENSGMHTTLADNGFSAIELLKHQEFDLIIMDIQMPEIDGRETTVKIRKELGLLDIPIIAMTASVLADESDKCKAAGMNEYISKPFVKEDLFEKMLLFI
ncbi:ATP-binding protein [Pedobacter psychroterrae]|uniref:Sensory/regulatory protein RpfC n=1 Tax=Pedobacter psychroterrae TaxID=2530453 RepID=A0A4R0NMC8_9SPHI|nr:ATP-binding protein [Pedobacter psychroterrae]TCD00215.1 response regulator [Pedobacter psychroterrae]